MKSGARALGVAESYASSESTFAGAVVRADRVIEGFSFATCTVGGTDSTDAVIDCWTRLDREDVSYVLVAGIAPAWYNIIDLHRLAEATDRPVLSVSFEASDGLEEPIRTEFDNAAAARRLETYRAQPDRCELVVDGQTLYVRAVGLDPDRTEAVIRGFTPEGGRPEPLRIARLAARAGDALRRDG